jgi:hypothetical protein
MRDPTGALETFPDNLLLYIRTAFGTQFSGFERERLRRLPGKRASGWQFRTHGVGPCQGVQ